MHSYSISKLLDLEGLQIKKFHRTNTSIKFYATTTKRQVLCPACKATTSKVHDYRNQVIKDLPINAISVQIILKKRRYVCSCGKRFYEDYSFLPKYQRKTNRLNAFICNQMAKSIPVTTIAGDLNLSAATVTRIFDHVSYPKPSRLPKVLAIDEFKGNAETGKYQCILVDPVKKRVLDILPDRRQHCLVEYFKSIPRFERNKVKFFVCDMWAQYAKTARIFFPNAKIIVDKYHFIRQVTWAVENIRKRVQKSMPASLRKYFKRSRTLILKRFHNLTKDQKERLEAMLLYSEDLRAAYWIKEKFYMICKMDKYSEQRKAYVQWVQYVASLQLTEFKSCMTAFQNWHKEILNALKHGYTNGPTEGFNNKITVLKRVSYGIKNFTRFRNRILHICY